MGCAGAFAGAQDRDREGAERCGEQDLGHAEGMGEAHGRWRKIQDAWALSWH